MKPDVEKKRVFYLDRDHESLKQLTVPELPRKRYNVEPRAPYRITTSDGRKDSATRGIAILDTTQELVLHDSAKLQVIGSHYETVRRVFSGKAPLLESYAVGISGEPRRIDYEKVITVLEHILKTHTSSGVTAINLSFGRSMSLEQLNNIVQAFASEKTNEIPLTRENIAQHARLIRNAFAQCPADHSDKSFLTTLLKQADLVQRLSDAGVVVIQGAGNDGPDHILLLAALVPEVVVVGGLNGRTPDKKSGNSSLVDAWSVYPDGFNLPNGTYISLEGTSFAAPDATEEVVVLREEGFSPAQINDLYRERSKHLFEGKVERLILRDGVRRLEPLVKKQDYSGEQLETMRTSFAALSQSGFRNEIALLDLIIEAKTLKLGEAMEFFGAVDSATDAFLFEKDKLKRLVLRFSAVDPSARASALARLRDGEKRTAHLEELEQRLFPKK